MPADSVKINQIAIFCNDSNYLHASFDSFNLYVSHTSLSELTTSFDSNYTGNTPLLIMHRDTLAFQCTYNQWTNLTFDSAFKYNGTDNLIFEIQWTGSDAGSVYSRAFVTDVPRVLDGYRNFPTGTVHSSMNSLQIFYSTYGIAEESKNIVSNKRLYNCPNPVINSTDIKYELSRNTNVNITIYNLSGQKITTLVTEYKKAGSYTVKWDGKDNKNNKVNTGTYFYTLKTDDYRMSKKLTILK
jgi:hypothetical protein